MSRNCSRMSLGCILRYEIGQGRGKCCVECLGCRFSPGTSSEPLREGTSYLRSMWSLLWRGTLIGTPKYNNPFSWDAQEATQIFGKPYIYTQYQEEAEITEAPNLCPHPLCLDAAGASRLRLHGEQCKSLSRLGSKRIVIPGILVIEGEISSSTVGLRNGEIKKPLSW